MSRTKQERAGIIPYYFEGNKILMLFMKPSNPRYGGDVFQIGKGRIDPGETPQQAAIREGKEELGLFSGNIVNLEKLGIFLGYTTIFLAEIKIVDMFGDTGYETKTVRWMTEEDFLKEGRRLHKPIIKSAIRRINKIKGVI